MSDASPTFPKPVSKFKYLLIASLSIFLLFVSGFIFTVVSLGTQLDAANEQVTDTKALLNVEKHKTAALLTKTQDAQAAFAKCRSAYSSMEDAAQSMGSAADNLLSTVKLLNLGDRVTSLPYLQSATEDIETATAAVQGAHTAGSCQ